jgi:hypothetical protein
LALDFQQPSGAENKQNAAENKPILAGNPYFRRVLAKLTKFRCTFNG